MTRRLLAARTEAERRDWDGLGTQRIDSACFMAVCLIGAIAIVVSLIAVA